MTPPPNDPVSTDTAEHYAWGDGCDGWHLLREPHLSVIAERVPAGAAETAHTHAQAHQFFYILEGEATMELGERRVLLREGQGLHVPPGQPHRFVNASSSEVRFLVVSSPPSHGDRTNLDPRS